MLAFHHVVTLNHHVMMNKPTPIPTQRLIAESIGLSRVTVSHILGGREIHRYNEETRRKVLEAAERLGYRPNRAAQTIRKGRSNLIGVVHFGVSNHIARQNAYYLPQAISSSGFEPLVVDLSWHGNSYRRALEHLLNARVEGAIIAGLVETFGPEEIQLLPSQGVPTILLATAEHQEVPVVCSDSRMAFRLMVEHLCEEGHRNLLLLTNDYQSLPTQRRIAGFEEGVAGLAPTGLKGNVAILPADRDIFSGGAPAYHYVKKLIAGGELPDAILCLNDQWAQAVFTAALEAGLRIPEDLAVTGFDNEPFGNQLPYLLTTASPDVARTTGKAMELLMGWIAGEAPSQRHYTFPCHLIKRRSSAGPRTLASAPPTTTAP